MSFRPSGSREAARARLKPNYRLGRLHLVERQLARGEEAPMGTVTFAKSWRLKSYLAVAGNRKRRTIPSRLSAETFRSCG